MYYTQNPGKRNQRNIECCDSNERHILQPGYGVAKRIDECNWNIPMVCYLCRRYGAGNFYRRNDFVLYDSVPKRND